MGFFDGIFNDAPSTKLARAQNLLKLQQLEDEIAADEAAKNLLSGQFDAKPAGLDENTEITWNQARPEDKEYKRNLLSRIDPEGAVEAERARLLPGRPKPMIAKKDDRIVIADDPEDPMAFRTVLDAAPEEFKPTNMQLPGTDRVKVARTPEQFESYADQGYAPIGNTVPGARVSDSGQESWANPVPEIDAVTGKPIQVRYGSKGGRQVVGGATPAKQGNAFDRNDYWRSQLKPFVDSATEARVQSSKVRGQLQLKTGTAQIAAINAVQKMIDQGAVVRDQDVALIQSAQSLMSRLEARVEGLKSGKLLSPELQKELQQVADGLERAIYDGVNERVSAYEPTMVEEGVGIDSVVPPAMRTMFAPKSSGELVANSFPGTQQNAPVQAPQWKIGQARNIRGARVTKVGD
jgi:hypothetical protein